MSLFKILQIRGANDLLYYVILNVNECTILLKVQFDKKKS